MKAHNCTCSTICKNCTWPCRRSKSPLVCTGSMKWSRSPTSPPADDEWKNPLHSSALDRSRWNGNKHFTECSQPSIHLLAPRQFIFHHHHHIAAWTIATCGSLPHPPPAEFEMQGSSAFVLKIICSVSKGKKPSKRKRLRVAIRGDKSSY